MTVAQAASALGGKSYETNGLTEILTFPMNESKGGTPLTVQAQYAADLWNYWKTTAAAGVSTLGAAAASVKTWASGVLFGGETAGTLAGTGGLLTMSLPAVAAAAAPILGVSLGATLYQSNPELWNKISQTLLPWAYKDTQTMPVVVDSNGQAYLPKEALEALQQLFNNENIGLPPSYEQPSSQFIVTNVMSPMEILSIVEYYLTNYQNVFDTVESMFRTAESLYYPGRTCLVNIYIGNDAFDGSSPIDIYIGNESMIGRTVTLPYSEYPLTFIGSTGTKRAGNPFTSFSFSIVGSSYVHSVQQCYVNSTDLYINGQNLQYKPSYPEGTSKWNGNSVDIENTPVKPVISTTGGLTKPYFPVHLPIGDPTVSPDPSVQPNPIAPSTAPEIEPYISPETIPESWPEYSPDYPEDVPDPTERIAPQVESDPIYVPTPNLDPSTNPSTEPDPITDPEQEPARPIPPPQPGGVTPGIIWPPSNFPTIVPTTGSGLVHVYNPTSAEFISFGNWLWVTYADPSIDKLWNNPFDGIIGAHELYATPSKDGTDTIKSGFLDSGINSTIVQNRYVSINCGSIVIPEYYGNYLDYSPYSKAFIYLPFIGIVEVDVDDIVGHSVNILYHVDSYNGSCIAQVTVAKTNYTNTIYQFSGNCAVDIPLAGGSQAAIRAGMISAAAYGIGSTVNGVINGAALGAVGGLAGAVLGGVTGAIGSAGAGIANVVSQKSTVQHSGSFGASYGAMGIKTPYIIIRRPVQKFVNGYQHDYGYPAYIRVTVGSCTGYLRVREVNVQSTLATDDEKVMIENLLKSGVYID